MITVSIKEITATDPEGTNIKTWEVYNDGGYKTMCPRVGDTIKLHYDRMLKVVDVIWGFTYSFVYDEPSSITIKVKAIDSNENKNT